MTDRPQGTMAVVVSDFPGVSETAVRFELLALREHGLLSDLFATGAGVKSPLQPGCESLLSLVQWLPAEPVEVQAEWMARRLEGRPIRGIHACRAGDSAAVAEEAALLLGLPFSFSVHAREVRELPEKLLCQRTFRARAVITGNPSIGLALRRQGAAVHVIPCGVDVDRFAASPLSTELPLRILGVGPLGPPRDFDVLIRAVAKLSVAFQLRIIGDGPHRPRLRSQIRESGFGKCIDLISPLTHRDLPAEFRAAQVVVVPSAPEGSGGCGDLPNVVLEAMASYRPIVASEVAAIEGVLLDGENAVLVPVGDADGLRAALELLAARPALRERLAARAWVRALSHFGWQRCGDRLVRRLAAAFA